MRGQHNLILAIFVILPPVAAYFLNSAAGQSITQFEKDKSSTTKKFSGKGKAPESKGKRVSSKRDKRDGLKGEVVGFEGINMSEAGLLKPPKFVATADVEALKKDLKFYLESSVFPRNVYSASLGLQLDQCEFPNSGLTGVSCQVLEVKDKNGSDLLARPHELRWVNCFEKTYSPNINAELKKGFKKEGLASAKLRFVAHIPNVKLFRATAADGPESQQRGNVTLEMTRPQRGQTIVSVRRKKQLPEQLPNVGGFATKRTAHVAVFDDQGRCLTEGYRQDRAGYIGPVAFATVAVVEEFVELFVETTVDLNQGKPLQVQKQPTDGVRKRFHWLPQKSFESTPRGALDGLKVTWLSGRSESDSGLQFAGLPMVSPRKASWDLLWLKGKSVVPLSGDNNDLLGRLRWSPAKFADFNAVEAVVGRVQVHVASGIHSVSIEADQAAAWQTVKFPDGRATQMRIEKQIVSWFVPPGVVVLEKVAYDEDGRRLQIASGEDSINLPSDQGTGLSSRCWGSPAKFELVLATEILSRVYPVDVSPKPLPNDRIQQFHHQASVVQKAASTLKSILQARQRSYPTPDDIAGLHYLYNRFSSEPAKLISSDIAHASPADAKRYGFEAKPLNGYYFELTQKRHEKGQLIDFERAEKPVVRKWEKGEIAIRPFKSYVPFVVARPIDPELPTLFASGSSLIHAMHTQGKPLEAIPQNPYSVPMLGVIRESIDPQILAQTLEGLVD